MRERSRTPGKSPGLPEAAISCVVSTSVLPSSRDKCLSDTRRVLGCQGAIRGQFAVCKLAEQAPVPERDSTGTSLLRTLSASTSCLVGGQRVMCDHDGNVVLAPGVQRL